MQRYLIIILVVIFVGGLFWYFKSGYEPIKPSFGTNIIFFGDSLVKGVGANEGKSLPSLLSDKIGLPVINAGVSGDTTEMGLVRLNKDVLQKDPKLVIIVLGGNDFLRRVPKAQTLANISSIVAQIKAQGAGVVLAGFNATIFGNYSSDYENIAEEEQVGFVPNIFSGVLGDKSLMSDTIHPNEKGYAKMVEKFVPVIFDILE